MIRWLVRVGGDAVPGWFAAAGRAAQDAAARRLRRASSIAPLAVLLLVLGGCAAPDAPPLEWVDELDLQRNQGTWYELANLSNRFQDQCVADTQAQYTLLDGASSREFLWVLARERALPRARIDELVAEATRQAFPVERVDFMRQEAP